MDVAARRYRIYVVIRTECGGTGHHSLHPAAQFVFVWSTEERVQVGDRRFGKTSSKIVSITGAHGVKARTTAFWV